MHGFMAFVSYDDLLQSQDNAMPMWQNQQNTEMELCIASIPQLSHLVTLQATLSIVCLKTAYQPACCSAQLAHVHAGKP